MSAISIMTPEQVDLIRQSFDAIWPVRRKLAVTFYASSGCAAIHSRTRCGDISLREMRLPADFEFLPIERASLDGAAVVVRNEFVLLVATTNPYAFVR